MPSVDSKHFDLIQINRPIKDLVLGSVATAEARTWTWTSELEGAKNNTKIDPYDFCNHGITDGVFSQHGRSLNWLLHDLNSVLRRKRKVYLRRGACDHSHSSLKKSAKKRKKNSTKTQHFPKNTEQSCFCTASGEGVLHILSTWRHLWSQAATAPCHTHSLMAKVVVKVKKHIFSKWKSKKLTTFSLQHFCLAVDPSRSP